MSLLNPGPLFQNENFRTPPPPWWRHIWENVGGTEKNSEIALSVKAYETFFLHISSYFVLISSYILHNSFIFPSYSWDLEKFQAHFFIFLHIDMFHVFSLEYPYEIWSLFLVWPENTFSLFYWETLLKKTPESEESLSRFKSFFIAFHIFLRPRAYMEETVRRVKLCTSLRLEGGGETGILRWNSEAMMGKLGEDWRIASCKVRLASLGLKELRWMVRS